ncbi:penicillin-binding protein 2 [Pleionea sp. CnH1-48]|uniref:penicillin-binding protein 2 n=1 Tax=Pleionea sp. CnH1-48 TaxID=2954494 RepID=UPI0020970DF1|nr:penicillin-binding protein 2 [Pleionea sp. CnH1-48]MCO7227380.1 penicillin-binding protein 2 [Pleionea sp. CnH1-48]
MLQRKVTIKNPFRELAYYQSRVFVAFFIIIALMAGLLFWVANLQVFHYENYRTRSDANRIRVRPVAPTRGLIYDRNGVILAENRSVYSLELIPEQVDDIDETLSQLKELLQLDDDDIERFHKEKRYTRRERFKKIPIKQKLTEKQVALFAVNRFRFKGVSVEARLVRYYPYGSVLVHALGYVGRINDREKARIDAANYKATHHIGKVGLEKHYESILHGTIGSRVVEVDVHERVLRTLSEQTPQNGVDLHLSLDVELQLAAEKALAGRRGVIVALDPANGDVLALVSNPGYNPNLFVTGISSKDYNKLLKSQDRPLFNRALRGQYSPGSTIKPHMAWLGLTSGMITPSYTVEDPGFFMLPNDERRYRDWKKLGHGKRIGYKQAIAQSCDTFFYDLAVRLGIDRIHPSMSKFGFGQLTGIDMGEEVPGLMPSRDWKRGARRAPWYPGETVIIGIGQGYWTATPLQIANSAAVIANDGKRYQLRLVNSQEANGVKTFMAPQLAEQQIDIGDGQHFDLIKKAMKEVNHGLRGSAREAFRDAPYESAGKTGTVQLVGYSQDEEYDKTKVAQNLHDNALYIGYAPYEKPQIAVAIVLENAGGGGSNAAPVARKVMDFYLESKPQKNKEPNT